MRREVLAKCCGSALVWLCLCVPIWADTPIDASVLVDLPRIGKGGSGVAIHPHLIVTNAHVVENKHRDDVVCTDIRGQRFRAQTVAIDPAADLALLWCDGRRWPFVRLADRDPQHGRALRLLGWGSDRQLKEGAGPIVSTKTRGPVRVFMTAVSSEPGDSGGGLFDRTSGELLAVNWGAEEGSNYSASTPVSYLRSMAEAWVTEAIPRERWQEFACLGGQCASPTAGSARGVAPPKWPIAPPVDSLPPSVTVPPSASAPPTVTAPPAPQFNTDQLVGQIVEKLAADERFRGPPGAPGKDGADGEPGPPGKDGKDASIDEEAIVAKVLARIDLDEIAARVPRAPAATPAAETHYVLVGDERVADWSTVMESYRYARARFQGLTTAAPPPKYVGQLPALVRYTDSVGSYVARGAYETRNALAELASGKRP